MNESPPRAALHHHASLWSRGRAWLQLSCQVHLVLGTGSERRQVAMQLLQYVYMDERGKNGDACKIRPSYPEALEGISLNLHAATKKRIGSCNVLAIASRFPLQEACHHVSPSYLHPPAKRNWFGQLKLATQKGTRERHSHKLSLKFLLR